MQHRNFVIYDNEEMYAKNFMDCISTRKEVAFQVRMFRDVEKLLEYSKEQVVNFMLITEECPAAVRQQVRAQRTFVLTKGVCTDLGEKEKSILKYQSADEILAEILESCLETGDRELGLTMTKGAGAVIGVYSPVHRIGKTKLALAVGKEQAKNGPALYLNLEEYSGAEAYFGERPQQNLADLLYYARQENGNLGIRISTMVHQDGELDYIYPMEVAGDIRNVTLEEWKELLEQIADKSIYDTVILDLGDSVQGLYELLMLCDTVYTPFIEEPTARAKMRQYEENLMLLGYQGILEHTVKKEVHARKGRERKGSSV